MLTRTRYGARDFECGHGRAGRTVNSSAGGRRRRRGLGAVLVALLVVSLAGACRDEGDEGSSTREGSAPADTTLATTPLASRPADTSGCPGATWMDPDTEPSERARRLVAAMSLDQKIGQLHGEPTAEDFRHVAAVPDLCVPALTLTNGPAGVGTSTRPDGGAPATALPAPLALAATWDPAMASRYGDVMGTEARLTGRNLLEAPAVDVMRTPLGGRTFESFGEDPLLAARIAVPEIRAVQDRGVLANVKHYVLNNQERDREDVSVVVGPRALHELYLPPFEAAVRDAEVASVMCAYNRVDGVYSCENEPLLTGILRDELGFEGFVLSDFTATHSTEASVRAGLDLELPFGLYYGDPLRAAVAEGRVPEAALDEMLARRFTQMFRLGVFDRAPDSGSIDVEAHALVARRVAEAGTVLLRNERATLPLDAGRLRSLAVLGPWADRAATGGGGSSAVAPLRTISPLEGIRARVGADVEVVTADGDGPDAAAEAAASADVAVVVVGQRLTEGRDRTGLALPAGQDALVRAVAAANPRTVVVLHVGAPVTMPWLDDVAATVLGWYPGQEDGAVTAAVLFGDAEPGGRLPVTFPASLADVVPPGPASYPGVDGVVRYREGLLVGYRRVQALDATPRFPFGFGLSYTTFALDDLEAPSSTDGDSPVTVRVRVRNTGDRSGSEVVQAYVAAPEEPGTPPTQLRGFAKVPLEPGASAVVTLELDPRAFSRWDEATRSWRVVPGRHRLLIGTSSVDTPLSADIEVGGR